MNLSIGAKIKQLRKQNDVTQEKLADYLNISYQAISKWENESALPDITMVIPIANFFRVTIDELFDMDTQRQEQEIKEIQEENTRLRNKGLLKESVELLHNAIKKYPNNYDLLILLASNLFALRRELESKDDLFEIIKICEQILADCTEDDKRESAISLLAYTYYHLDNEEKAIEYADKAHSINGSREILLPRVYNDPIKTNEFVQGINLRFMDYLNSNILDLMNYETTEERIFANETMLKMWQLLIYDGNYLFYHCRIADIHTALAVFYARLQNKTKVFEHLNAAKEHARIYDTIPEGIHHYTSVFTAAAVHNKELTSKNYKETDSELLVNNLNNECFDFIRNDPEFIEFIDKIKTVEI